MVRVPEPQRVREALQGLERSGLVRIRPKQGTYVAELSLPERFEAQSDTDGFHANAWFHAPPPTTPAAAATCTSRLTPAPVAAALPSAPAARGQH